MRRRLIFGALVAAVGCGGGVSSGEAAPKSDAQYRAEVAAAMSDALTIDLEQMVKAATELHDLAPTVDDRGWDPQLDAGAIVRMRAAWFRARSAYEHIEGAIAPLFPEIDAALDARYEEALPRGGGGDPYLFDDQGVVGMDAIERILYADSIPARVVTYESALPGYRPAAFPGNERESRDFKTLLSKKLIDDATLLLQK